ncbi:MAG TPA: hypothetical protein PK879_06705 [Opitutaceae bacterium]|jgi:hypothetical protein|nr:hypothetical protein [Opitutaceae bacterium]HPO00385.1 hypothetical protein [Opitutaceae bacterium]
MNTQEFQHNGKNYEVRIISDGQSVFVKVFTEGRPANGLRYEATLETIHDAATVTDLDIVKELIKTAQSDITKN